MVPNDSKAGILRIPVGTNRASRKSVYIREGETDELVRDNHRRSTGVQERANSSRPVYSSNGQVWPPRSYRMRRYQLQWLCQRSERLSRIWYRTMRKSRCLPEYPRLTDETRVKLHNSRRRNGRTRSRCSPNRNTRCQAGRPSSCLVQQSKLTLQELSNEAPYSNALWSVELKLQN